nr:hypothetical protein GCM10017745_46650 [Saccharothrix mutabilis subsp. capreolus]
MDSPCGASGALDPAAGDGACQDFDAGVFVAPQPDRCAEQCADRVGVEGRSDGEGFRSCQP